MDRMVALLRGVNVGGRKLAMADLRASLAKAGCRDVATYIQSGNAVFTPPPKLEGTGLEAHLEAQLELDCAMAVPIFVRSAAELGEVLDHNPYPGTPCDRLVVWFLRDAASADPLGSFDPSPFAPETFRMRGREVYLFLPDGQARSPLLTALGKLRPPIRLTARNWNTVQKLHAMATTEERPGPG